eukprot:SAG31_NODE_929_length_10926_cov_8.162834_9_plen_142_part_00
MDKVADTVSVPGVTGTVADAMCDDEPPKFRTDAACKCASSNTSDCHSSKDQVKTIMEQLFETRIGCDKVRCTSVHKADNAEHSLLHGDVDNGGMTLLKAFVPGPADDSGIVLASFEKLQSTEDELLHSASELAMMSAPEPE